jgi:gliding motility-associated-like protein
MQSRYLRVFALLFLVLVGGAASSQTFIASDGAVFEACSGRFYDSGGPSGPYSDLEDITVTICPTGGAGAGPMTSVRFTQFDVQLLALTDRLVIHDGTSTSDPIIGTGDFLNNLTGQTFTASGPSGCLTFHWTSDLLITSAGWAARIITGPNAGTNATTTVCSSASPFAMIDLLGGFPEPTGTWTGPGDVPHGDTFDPATDPPGVYTYTVSGPAPCPDSSATLTISVVQAADAGSDGAVIVCSNDPAFDLFDHLGGTPEPDGAWTGPDSSPVSGTFTPGTSPPGVYTYTVPGVPPCGAASATVTVTQVLAPNAGLNRVLAVCSDDAPFDMRSRLNGTPDPGGTWVGPNGPHDGTFDPATDPGGSYVYTVEGSVPCADASATLFIIRRTAPNAGEDGSVVVCSDDGSFSLFAHLGGDPDAGGIWTDPNGDPHSGTFIPGTSLPGDYTYTVTGLAPCDPAVAIVSVAVTTAPEAGINSNVVRCSDDAPFDLFDQLGGSPDPGGTWTGPDSQVHGGSFTPGTDMPGVYVYTVAGTAPCDDAQAFVTVGIVEAPNAGTGGAITVCSNDAPFDLFPLIGGGPDANGSWSDPVGEAFNGHFIPGTSLPGTYTYTVPGLGPCDDDHSTVEVTVVPRPDPGTNGSLTVCSDAAPVDLFTMLGGTPELGGTWTTPGGNPHTGIYQPGSQIGGTYTYTVTGNGPCADASAVVQVVRVIAPRAGTDGTITVCSTNGPFNLITALGGNPHGTGSWFGPGMAPVGPVFTPGTSQPGVYTYVVPGTAPCVNDTSYVTVNVNQAANAGSNGNITVCSSMDAFALVEHLGGNPDLDGTWSDPDGNPHSGEYQPGISLPGGYTYTVTGDAPCPNASAIVVVTERRQPEAGISATFERCDTDAPVQLFNILSGTPDPGGVWTGPNGPSSGLFIPGTSDPGVYTYTLTGTAPCVDTSATVTAIVNAAPNAGSSVMYTVCEDHPSVDLFGVLGGTPDPGGTWSDDDGTGQLSGQFMVPIGLLPGDYDFTYTVPGDPPCGSAQATVTVRIVPALNAGSNGNLSVCSSETQVDLFTGLGNNPQQGGVWIDLAGTGALSGHHFNAQQVGAGTYQFRYLLTGTATCASDSAQVTVTVTAAPNAGTNGSTLTCSSAAPFNMFPFLGGSPQGGGTWARGVTPHPPNYNPAVDSSGVFTYTVQGTGPCPSASATVTVTEIQAPYAGPSSPLDHTVCSNDGPVDMTALLGPNVQPGTWSFGGQEHSNIFIPGLDEPGIYTYTVGGTAPCPNATSSLNMIVRQAPDAGQNGSREVCDTENAFLLISLLGPTAQSGGAWEGPSGPHDGLFIPGVSEPGDYFYTVAGQSPCAADVAVATVYVNAQPEAGDPGSVQVCPLGGGNIDLFAHIGGSPDPGGIWTRPDGLPFGGTFVPGVHPPGTYKYKVLGTPPCTSDSTTVTVSVSTPPSAGTSRAITICSSAGAFAMVDSLGGTPSLVNGQWMGPAPSNDPMNGVFIPGVTPPGLYTYTVTGTPPCANATATLNITVNPRPNAGTDGQVTLCRTDGAFNLFSLLGPGAQQGGSWVHVPTSTPHSGTLQPATDLAGVYKYTVTGLAPCGIDEAFVNVTLHMPPNAGINGLAIICDDQLPFQLRNYLGGTPSSSGTWYDPHGHTHTGVFIPGTDTAGVYTYVVAGSGTCADASSQVTVIQHARPHAGGNGVHQVCSDEPPFQLFDHLTGNPDQGGEWFNALGEPVAGTYVPGSTPPGVYKYRIQGTSPCASDSATVTVFENTAPHAGCNTTAAICSADGPVDLVSLLGCNPDPNGTWRHNNMDHGSVFDPAVDGGGAYVYTVQGINACPDATAQVYITIHQAPNAGGDGTIPACVDNTSIDLFSGLVGAYDANGTWLDSDGTGQLNGAEFSSVGMQPGSYRFTYVVAGTAPCSNDSAVVVVNVVEALNAGEDATLEVCRGEVVDLFAALNGTPQSGGIWIDVDGSGALVGHAFNSLAVPPGMWRFDHVIPGSAQCTGDTARIAVMVLEAPNAGCGQTLTLCSSSAPVLLASSLACSPDGGGQWFDPLFGMHSGEFDPANEQGGPYAYVVSGVGSCPNDTALVNVVVVPAAEAGPDSQEFSICSSDPATSLFDLLGPDAQPGGSWQYLPGGTPINHSGVYNPVIDQPGTYRYTVLGSFPCPNDIALVHVSEPVAPFAGCPATVSVCSSQAPFNMRQSLGCSPQTNGFWFTEDGVAHAETFDPAIDAPGVYMYVVPGIAPCVADTNYLTIQVTQAHVTGPSSLTVAACVSQTAVDLFAALGPTAHPGGTWLDLNGTGALSGTTFNASMVGTGTYQFRYFFPANGPCPAVASTVTVNVVPGASAGVSSEVLVCGAETSYDLIQGLGGTPDLGGAWSAPSGSPGLMPGGHLDATQLGVGNTGLYQYTVVDPVCGTIHATVEVTAAPYPDAGTGGNLLFCNTDSPVDLFGLLGGTPQDTGIWTGPGGAHTGVFNPGTDPAGTYTYTVHGNVACADATATFAITVNAPPDAGRPGSVLVCDTVPSLALFDVLEGTPQAGGIWADMSGSGGLSGELLNTTGLPAGSYTFRYLVNVPGCGGDSAFVTVEVVESISVHDVVTECNEQDRTYLVTFSISGGDPGSYQVDGLVGTLSTTVPVHFISAPILTSAPYEVVVYDQHACNRVVLSGTTPCDFDTEVFVPQSFSPNDDNINDVLIIPGIEGFPGNRITIFNRWGSVVYKASGYDNASVRWDGSSSDAVIGGTAPSGTYFYVLELGDGIEPLTGYIHLNR